MDGREKSKGGAPVWEVLIQTGAKDWVETDPSLLHIFIPVILDCSFNRILCKNGTMDFNGGKG